MADLEFHPPWMAQGLCATDPELDTDDFFFEGRFVPNSAEYNAHVAFLRRVCGRCPCRVRCREYAISTDIRYGFWGGMTTAERYGERWPTWREPKPAPPPPPPPSGRIARL